MGPTNRSLSPVVYVWYAAAGAATAIGPWIGLHLGDVGLSASATAAVLGALPLGRLLGAPLWGWVADRSSAPTVLRVASVLATLLGIAWAVARLPWLLAPLVLAWAMTRAPWFPIMDASTVQAVGRRYGPVRAVASVGFLVSMMVAGVLRDVWAPAPLALGVASMALATAASFGIRAEGPPPTAPPWRALGALLKHGELRALLAASALHGASLSTYDLLFSTHLRDLGAPTVATSIAFALGVGVEIALMLFASRLLAWLGAGRLMLLGLAAGVPRFLVLGTATSVPVMVGIQALHGLHFGAFWVAGTALFAERAPPELRNTTQALLPAAAYGVGPLLGMGLATAWLQVGTLPGLYLAMAGVSALASLILWWGPLRSSA